MLGPDGQPAPFRRDRVRSLRAVRVPVPPRSGRHRARRRDDRELRPRHLRLFADVDDGALRRRGDRPDAASASATARCSCSRPEAWTRPSPRGCWPWRSAPERVAAAAHRQRPDAEGREPARRGRPGVARAGRTPDVRRRAATPSSSALAGVVEPERKRRIIGDTFVAVFDREARRLGIERHLLAQGTIYPDTIETGGTKRADTIKTHHNRVPIIQEMIAAGRVVEPLAELYKVEVRELGERLGVPREMCGGTRSPGRDWASGCSARPARRTARTSTRSSRDSPRSRGRLGIQAARAAHPFRRRQGRPAFLRAPGAAPRRVRLGRPAARRRHHLQGGAARQPVHLVARPGGADPLPAARGHDDARPSRPVARGRRAASWTAATSRPLRLRSGSVRPSWCPLEVDGVGREFVIVRPIHSERGMTATPADLPRAVLAETAGAGARAAGCVRTRARRDHEAAGHHRVGVAIDLQGLLPGRRCPRRLIGPSGLPAGRS